CVRKKISGRVKGKINWRTDGRQPKGAAGGVFFVWLRESSLTRMEKSPDQTLASLRDLYPGLTETQYADLDAWYTGYASLILRMYERITNDPAAYADFLALTSRPSRPSMTGKVDSPKQTTNS